MSGVEARDPSDLRKYRTEIPNVVLEMGLSPYALALYVHLKRTAGQDGFSTKGTRRLAKETGMSAGKITDARSELESHDLIQVERPKVNGSRQTAVATIIDVWEENFEYFSSRKKECERSSGERSVHQVNTERSSGERRKEPLRKEPSRKPPVGAAEPPRIDLIKVLVDDLDALDVYLSNDEKRKYAGQIKQLRDKDVPDKRIIRGLKRLVADWDRFPHTSVQKALSFAEGNTRSDEKPTKALVGSPPELIESLRSVSELKRYAAVAETYDFSRLERGEEPPWPIYSQLGGDSGERQRNLQRILSRTPRKSA